jgi:hypothetical protein
MPALKELRKTELGFVHVNPYARVKLKLVDGLEQAV